MSYLNKRRRAFFYAFTGLRKAFREEAHLRLHGGIAAVVVVAGGLAGLSTFEWLLVLFCIALVIAAELFNAALERLCDLVMPQQHPAVAYIKDVSAGAVLVVCVAAAITGTIVFWPYLLPAELTKRFQ